ncbi:MAG TPA: hypothetical protein DIU39_09165 [Flavobacteriales bacterium]|nr:hypothetical protein [Flavobacteriales bacterium]|tara:strand:+ start:28834 stop:30021 length:1188 start_codon:yes stop_codon:yes gene_type:complete
MEIDSVYTEEIRAIINEYKHLPLSEVSLKLATKKHLPRTFILNQINGLQKAKEKLPSFIKNGLIFPPKVNLEQCSSEATAKFKQSILSGNTLLDLTMGFGVDVLFLSDVFNSVTAVEPNKELTEVAQYNFDKSGNSDKITIVNNTAEQFLHENQQSFDWIYIDPSRREQGNKKVVDLKKYSPDVTALLPQMFRFSSNVLIKISPFADITYLHKLFNCIDRTYVVSVKNECKEILLLLKKELNSNRDEVITVNLLNEQTQLFTYHQNENDISNSEFYSGNFQSGYIYLPNVSVNKSQAYGALVKEFQLKAISLNTHIFWSEDKKNNFPGDIFEIVELVQLKKLNDKTVQVILKNYPLSHQQFLKKYKFSKGNKSQKVLLGFRDNGNKLQHLLLNRV